MNKIIEEIIKKRFEVKINYDIINERLEYTLEGFYKSGDIKLYEEDGQLIALARYNEKTEINSFSDVVHLNYYWWNYSKDRDDFWNSPGYNWLPFLLEEGLVTKDIQVIEKYK
jgi:hypothetical protein